MNKGKKYDQKEAYNKNLSASDRLHYLENARHDTDSAAKMAYGDSPAKMQGSFLSKHCQSGFQSAKPDAPAKKKSCKY